MTLGIDSVEGVSMPYEDYGMTGKKTIIRFYIDDAKVAYSVKIYEGEVTNMMMNIEIGMDIPSYVLEFPPDYTIEEEPPHDSSNSPPEKPAP